MKLQDSAAPGWPCAAWVWQARRLYCMTHIPPTTYHRTTDLLHDHNRVGAHSEILHFGSRNLSMLAGAELGAGVGAALGVETGPGLLVTGAIGGIAGAVGGEKIANAIDEYRIYNQDDDKGQRWHYDASHSDHGWTRQVPTGEWADNRAYAFGAMPTPEMRTVQAEPAVANELNFKASNQAMQLALGHAGASTDPYTVPASSADTASLRASAWTRDPQSHAWSREVVSGYIEHGMANVQREQASPPRAAALDRQSAAITAQNAAHTPQAMAARYEASYAQNGWHQHGPIPAAVIEARHKPTNVLSASDGHTYTRDREAQWQTPGFLYGTHAANGNVRDELNATSQAQARLLESAHAREAASIYPSINAPGQQSAVEDTSRADARESAPAPINRHSSIHDMFEALSAAAANHDIDGMRTVSQAYGQSAAGQAWLEQGQQVNQQAQQAMLQAQQAQAPQQAPMMR